MAKLTTGERSSGIRNISDRGVTGRGGTHGRIADRGGTHDGDHAGTITIECATCVMRETEACADCVVTFLCDREPTDAVLLDLSELQALRRLAEAGLAPGLRHTTR